MLNIKSKTGYALCMLMNNWKCDMKLPDKFCECVQKRNVGHLGTFAERIIQTNKSVSRIVINQGPYCDTADKMCMDLSGDLKREIFLPKWTVIDFLINQSEDRIFQSLTFIQSGPAHKQFLYIDGKKQYETEGDVSFFGKVKNVFSKFGLAEFWGKCTGLVKPCWGQVYKNDLYFGEVGFHKCFVGDKLPEYIDQTDLGKIEGFLSSAGLDKNDFIRPGITRDEIVETLVKIEETRK